LKSGLAGIGIILMAVGGGINAVHAASFALPPAGTEIVGTVHVVHPRNGNTLLDIARHYDLGYQEITAANPGISVWLPPADARVVVPTEFILPPKPWIGIIVNIPERRLFYFPKPHHGAAPRVITFPLGIAREGWPTPLGKTRIIAKFKNPSWIVPQSIRREHEQQDGRPFPRYFPPGPDNPMGMLALETGFSEIFIHGTDKPWGVGMRPSHGCLHLYPEDAAELFPMVRRGTPVRIINNPVTAGRRHGKLYVAVFEPVADYPHAESLPTRAVAALVPYLPHRADPLLSSAIDLQRVQAAVTRRSGIPTPVSSGVPPLDRMLAEIRAQPYTLPPYGAAANTGVAPGADSSTVSE
jgi:L,D-transpeptidase ErfK/SrfK